MGMDIPRAERTKKSGGNIGSRSGSHWPGARVDLYPLYCRSLSSCRVCVRFSWSFSLFPPLPATFNYARDILAEGPVFHFSILIPYSLLGNL
jgi:hypothetical protein